MAEKRLYPQFIGKYGEEIKIFQIKERKNHDVMLIRGFGLDKDGKPAHVEFHASKTTGKKEGLYIIYERISGGFGLDASKYKNDVMTSHTPLYAFCSCATSSLKNSPKTPLLKFLSAKCPNVLERNQTAKRVKDVRKLFSDTSVIEAIKTGDLVKVKNAMTKAITGTHKIRKEKE